jgi:hypothetical protein
MYYEQGTLCKFIGDFLVNIYSKKNAINQSMWNSDTSRLTYIVNELQESGKIRWVRDKKGLKVKQYVIKPLLEYLLGELQKYMNKYSMKTDVNILSKLQIVVEIYPLIEKDILADDIVRYMAPYFCLLREEDNIKQIEAPIKDNSIKQIEAPIKKTETPTIKKTETPTIKKTETPAIKKTETPSIKKTETPSIKKIPVIKKTETPVIKKSKAKGQIKKQIKTKTKAKESEESQESSQDSDSEKEFIKALRELKAEQKLQLEQEAKQVKVSKTKPVLDID